MSIDVSKIKPGDLVTVEFWDDEMKDFGAPPVESRGIVYPDEDGDLCVGAVWLDDSDDYTILEHVPARPDWADAFVVSDGAGIPFGNVDGWFVGLGGGMSGEKRDPRDIRGPVTVVLDADGNPPTPEPVWLDAEALEALPPETLVMTHRGMPRHRGEDDTWFPLGWYRGGSRSFAIAPARVLYTPEVPSR